MNTNIIKFRIHNKANILAFFIFCSLICVSSLSAQKINFGGYGDLDLQKMTKIVDRQLSEDEGSTTFFKGFQNETLTLFTHESRYAGSDEYSIRYVLYDKGEVAQIIEKVAYLDEDNDPFYNEIGYFYYWQYLNMRSGKIKSLDANIEEAGLQNTRCAGKEAPYCKEQLELKKIESETSINMMRNAQLALGQELKPDEKFWSMSGEFYSVIHEDGNLCTYTKDNKVKWCSGTKAAVAGDGVRLKFQVDGNLCIYDHNGGWVWCSNTNYGRRTGVTFHMDDYGNLRVRTASKHTGWVGNK